jgi:hypothetical protein
MEEKVFVDWKVCVVKLKQKGWGAESSVRKRQPIGSVAQLQ